MMNEKPHEHGPDIKFLLGFFIGGILGAIIIFLVGTKEGKKTTKILEQKGKDFVDDLEDRLTDLEKQGQELAKKSEEIKEHVVVTLEEKKEAMTTEASSKIDSTLAHIEALQEHGRETTASLRKRLFKNAPKHRG
jgi:gas vesicle protein